MIEKDILIFFDIDQTLISSTLWDFSPNEPAVTIDFWNRMNRFTTIILLSKRPPMLTKFFANRMKKAGWSVPDHYKGTRGFSKTKSIKEWINEIKPQIAFFVGNTRKDCESARENSCITIRYTKHDKSIIPESLENEVFSSDDPTTIEGFIEERLRKEGLWIEEKKDIDNKIPSQ